MARPKTLPDDHFRLSTFRRGDRTYIYGYRNVWDPVKRQSRAAKRIYVGTLNEVTGRALLGKTFLSNHPEYEGKTLYYENHELVEKSAEAVQQENAEREKSFMSNNVSYGAPWALWSFARNNEILNNLQEVFGQEDGKHLLALSIYQLLTGASFEGYEDWVSDAWLAGCAPLSMESVNELFGRIDHEAMMKYFRLRFIRSKENHRKIYCRSNAASPAFTKLYMAVDSIGVSDRSVIVGNTSKGGQKEHLGAKQINLTLIVDSLSGEVCFAKENDESVSAKGTCKTILKEMQDGGFDLSETALVTDRSYCSLYNLLNSVGGDVSFIAGVSMTELGLRDRFKAYQEDLSNIAFYNAQYDVYCRTLTERWNRGPGFDSTGTDMFLHLYRFPKIANEQTALLIRKIDKLIDVKNKGLEVDPKDWEVVAQYAVQDGENHWRRDIEALNRWQSTAGCFAIRSDCLPDSIETLLIYRRRSLVETAYRQFEVLRDASCLQTETVYFGKLMVHVIAQSLRMSMMVQAKNRETPERQIPGNSLEKMLATLKRIRAVRAPTRISWAAEPLSQNALDVFELLGLHTPPLTFKGI